MVHNSVVVAWGLDEGNEVAERIIERLVDGEALVPGVWATALFGIGSASPLFFVCLVTVPYLMFRREQRRLAQGFSLLAAACGFLSVVFMDHLPLRVQLRDPRLQTLFNTGSTLTLLFVARAAFARIVERSEDAHP